VVFIIYQTDQIFPDMSPIKRQHRKRLLLGEKLTPVEVQTLEDMAKNHRHGDFRRRALGVLALNDGRSALEVSELLRVSDQPVYNWAKAWRERGLAGLLTGHQGGAPVKLSAPLLDMAADIARQQPMTLGKIAQELKRRCADVPEYSLSRLSAGLKARGLSFKRNRLSLKKSAMPATSSACSAH
jgi:transposase